jgi:hypothetical protein
MTEEQPIWLQVILEEIEEEDRQAKLEDDLAFLAWAEKTHPGYLNNLKDGYRRYKEESA